MTRDVTYGEDWRDAMAFCDAWRRGCAIAGWRFFGDGTQPGANVDKWDMAPRYDVVDANIGILSSGEAAFLGAMYCFYNAGVGDELLRRRGFRGLGDIVAALDAPRRDILARLFIAYAGW